MPPKKEAAAGESLLPGFLDRETKLLAAAFLSTTAPDKYDYDIMAEKTGNTAGSLKKMWPPVKKKAMEAIPSFATFLGQAGAAVAAELKPAAAAKATKKRKAADETPEEDAAADANNDAVKNLEPTSAGTKSDNTKSDGNKSDSNKSDVPKSPTKKAPAAKKEKKAPATKGKGRPKKQVKEETASNEEMVKDGENSADDGDELGGEAEDPI